MPSNGKAARPGGGWGERPAVEANLNQHNKSSRIYQFDLPTGGLFGDVEPGAGFGDFLRNAQVGDALQTIFDPSPVSRSGILSNRDLLALHRIHSEADLALVKGFGRFLVIISAETFLEIVEGGAA